MYDSNKKLSTLQVKEFNLIRK